ncbi:amino acid/amide ABC transporter membrane protein 1, HAAT family [Halanaerobium congolense]|uniref:Amino acid/amide ABC transporter membrane protein 1, HAAT family n=1 Tax=Halanaerobium congolense TaxID=54121 RepID=A0A1G8JAZ7_9FIRM|nr:branched-chain amino acid ABC transporter permease [Halanaerobium congolense]SDI28415.1 amino acid/amide ABC transporter membrane protein 1, HAAT family [Halanaerobium congolense]SES81302.1 amino acid/amide ABC transporter membrane protein 1, HAAT family [Halanaerobium congolense]
MSFSIKENKTILFALAFIIIVGFWQPNVLMDGIQRGSMYAVIALPLALVLGILGVLNLAHGEFLTVGLYISYMFYNRFNLDPLLSIIPVSIILLVFGGLIYLLTVKRVIKEGHLNQLLLTFGISMILLEGVKMIWTTRPRNVFTDYAYASASIGEFSFGTYGLIYLLIAVLVLVFLQLFLKKTRLGQATFAVGQNPKGARIVGINVNLVYLFVFSISIAILGIVGGAMLPRTAIFPAVGSPYSLKSFALAAMAGLGNLNGILFAGIILGIGEAIINAIPGYSGWADLVFFGVLIIVILTRAFREAR